VKRLDLCPASVLVTCEHASNRIPARYARLGLAPRQVDRHIAWDPGAAVMARIVARRLGAPLHLARWSRLLVDLNRRDDHPKLIAPVTFGVRVPGNMSLPEPERVRRVRLYYRPYRDAGTAAAHRIVAVTGRCLHLSIHSFTPRVGTKVRRTDIGLLFDPRRRRERAFGVQLRPLLARHGLQVHFNLPYRGTSDGFTTALRARLPERRYLGLEIETNQRLLGTPASARRMGQLLAEALAACTTRPPRHG
jgi:predicted N-formylglutamate amidohydrolase